MKRLFLTLTIFILSISFYPVSAMEKTADILKKNVVTFGDGLYVDPTVDGRYIYRGGNPNNYIKLGDDLYRIISVEKDGTIKVIKQESIGSMAWDEGNARKSTNSEDFCTSTSGCKSWGNNTTTLDANGNKVTQMPWTIGDTLRNLPDEEASLNTYLNNDFYNGLSDDVKSLIVEKTWNVGPTDMSQTNLLESIKEESAYKWKGKVALINVTDYVKSSTNSDCKSVQDYQLNFNHGKGLCNNSISYNYLFDGTQCWTISPISYNYDGYVLQVNGIDGSIINQYTSWNYGVRPVFYLSSEITLTGKGTEINPYTLPKRNDVTEEPKDEENKDKNEVNVDNGQVVEVPSTSAFGSIIIAGLGLVCVTGSAIIMRKTTGKNTK